MVVPTPEGLVQITSLLGASHSAVVEYKDMLSCKDDSSSPNGQRTAEGLAALQKFLGPDHDAVREYQKGMSADQDKAKKEREEKQSPQERIAGKHRYSKILEGRKAKAASRLDKAKLQLEQAQKEMHDATERVDQVNASIQEVEDEIKALMVADSMGVDEEESKEPQSPPLFDIGSVVSTQGLLRRPCVSSCWLKWKEVMKIPRCFWNA